MMRPSHIRNFTTALVVCAATLGIAAPTVLAAEHWKVAGGTVTLTFRAEAASAAGLQVLSAVEEISASGDIQWVLVLPVKPVSVLTFDVIDGSVSPVAQGEVALAGSIGFATAQGQIILKGLTARPWDGESLVRMIIGSANEQPTGGLLLDRIKLGFDGDSRTLVIHAGSVFLSSDAAQALGHKEAALFDLGTVTIQAPAVWVDGDSPGGGPGTPRGPGPRAIGPDMSFCQLFDLEQYGRLSSLVGLGVATTSWNVGDADIQWFPIPATNHPFIVMNMYRAKDDRFEQVGQSWVKHGFYALGNTQCGGTCTFEPGHAAGDWLGVGCTDTYSSPLNASQNGLGPRYEINPWTGGWSYAGSHLSQGSHYHDGVQHRIEVADADLNPSQNPGATYYVEGYYAIADDVSVMNSAAWKPVTVSGSPGGSWSFSISAEGTPPAIGFAFDAWTGATQTIIAQEVPPVEFVSPDGRCILAAKATSVGTGMWHYEYALLNIDLDRQVGSFSIPLPAGITVVNVGFHGAVHHDEPYNAPGGVPIDNAVWTANVTPTAVTWSTTTNPVRWGTIYNFRFDANSAPENVTAALGLFKPGTPSSLTGTTVGPYGPPPVCGNEIVEGGEECDPPDGLHCNATCQWICGDGVVQAGEECDPPNGTTCDSNCQRIPICGDGFLDEGEDCDPPDGISCDLNCHRIPWCGDGILDPGEDCDPPDGVTCDLNCHLMTNDNCAAARMVCPPAAYGGSTVGMTLDGSAACGDSASTPDVWYLYVPRTDGTLHIMTCNAGNYDTVLSVHSGCPGTSTNEIACNDDNCSGTRSELFVSVTAEVTYLIRVSGWNGSVGDFVLTVEGPECLSNAVCGNEIVEPGEYCDPPNGVTCNEDCQRIPTCGDGILDPGEYCDPPDGVLCDANCQRIPGCGDGILDPGEGCDDHNTISGDGCHADCTIEPNGADLCADATPITDGAWHFSTVGATTDGPNEPVVCNQSGFTQVASDIWYCYTAPTSGTLTVSTCSTANYDSKIAIYEGCACPPTNILACNDDTAGCSNYTTVVTAPIVAHRTYLIRVGGYSTATGSGSLSISSQHQSTGDALRGGLLWDKWWVVNAAPEPTGNHPLYPGQGQQSGSITYRCKECHGWDYQGRDGQYQTGLHYTGIRGIFGTTQSPQQMFDIVKLSTPPNGHNYAAYGLNDQDVWDVVEFMQTQVIDTTPFVNSGAVYLGDPEIGQIHYEQDGTLACVQCHGFNGTMRNFGTLEHPEWVGTRAVEEPWSMFHKMRFGNPGTPMPSWIQAGNGNQGAADIGRYAQTMFPVDCLTDLQCDDGEVCNGQETCVSGRCVAGLPPTAFDADGFVGANDFRTLADCITGPCGVPPCSPPLYDHPCCALADAEPDGDVDMADFARFQSTFGHAPVTLKDYVANAITAGSTAGYSGRNTCGGCHDLGVVTNGFLFQDGRTDLQGNVIVGDDYFGDGRWWMRSPTRYGKWAQAGTWAILAAQHNDNASQIDRTTFGWVGNCGKCHPGGGPGEFDRDNLPLYNRATGKFGYELLGQTSADVVYNGDYANMSAAGTLSPARWDITGVSGPDCMYCHRQDRAWSPTSDLISTRRQATIAAGTALVNNAGQSVPAFEAAGTAGQGWLSNIVIQGGVATKLQIDYSVGIANGSLLENPDGTVSLKPSSLARPPRDAACWGCHSFGWKSLRSMTWFDNRLVHYRKFNKLNDADPTNDIPPEKSEVCNYCHPGDLHHNFAKGNSLKNAFRDELDWVNFRSCRDCHLADSPIRHPEAPVPASWMHTPLAGSMINKLSCQACHMPFGLGPKARLVKDPSLTGPQNNYNTDQFLSADPLDPTNPDKSRWYPAFMLKRDVDGVQRLFPVILGLGPYWADWDQKDTPADYSDDLVAPLPLWKCDQATGGGPLPVVTDDNADGKLEVNRPEEILAYIQALKGNDSYGNPIAVHPVLVKGAWLWYEDPSAPGGVSSLDWRNTGIQAEFASIGEMNHNIQPRTAALGYQEGPEDACWQCHRVYSGNQPTPVFDRLILVDPWGLDGQPVYETVRQQTGVSPP